MWNTSAFMQINKKKRIKIKMKMKKIKGQKGHKRKCREDVEKYNNEQSKWAYSFNLLDYIEHRPT